MAKELKRRVIAEFSAKNKAKGEMASFRRDMDSTGQAMKNMAKGALAMVGLGGGLYALKRGFDYVTKAAMKQEDAVFLLEAALKAVGEYTVEAMEGFEAFAASIQKATVYGDEEVLALMQLMKSLGVTSTALEQATKMAIGLAAATGRDVKSMSMYIALAQQGEFTMLRRYIPALRSTTDATEQLRIITEFAAAGFKIAEAQAETTSGSIAQLMNAVSDLAEVAGKPILEPMAESAGSLKILVEEATKGLDKFVKAWKEVGKARKELGLRPMDFPRIPIPDLEERFKKREIPPLSESEALLKAAKEYHEILVQQAKEEADVIKALAAEQTAAMQEHYDKRIAMGGNYQEMQERMARQRIETEIEVVTQQMEAETVAREKAAAEEIRIAEETDERRKRIAEDYASATATAWTDAFMRMATEGQKFGESMKQMLKELFAMIMRIYMYRQIAEPMATGIMAGVGALSGGGAGGTVTPEAGAMYARYQHGGVATRPHLAMVGEVPEAFVPLSGGRNIPVEMRGGSGITSFDVHIHNEGQEKQEISRVESYMVSDQRIIDVTTRAMQTDVRYRKSIAQARR